MSGGHTPGPWEVDGASCYIRPVNDDPENCNLGPAVACAVPSGKVWEEASANARLIAAAPDLLEQLREVVDFAASLRGSRWSDYEGDIDADLAPARAAIAKARGE